MERMEPQVDTQELSPAQEKELKRLRDRNEFLQSRRDGFNDLLKNIENPDFSVEMMKEGGGAVVLKVSDISFSKEQILDMIGSLDSEIHENQRKMTIQELEKIK